LFKFYKKREEVNKEAREEVSQTLTHVKFLKQYGLKDFFFKRCCDFKDKSKQLEDKI